MTLEQYAREKSIMLCRFLPGSGSEWFRKIGDEYYVCPKLAGAELQRQKTDAQVTKRALFRAKADSSYASPEGVQSWPQYGLHGGD